MAGTVLVTSRSFGSGSLDTEGALEEAGYRVVRGDPHHFLDALVPHLADAVAWIAGTAPVTAQMLAQAPALQVVARYGVGVDSVDLAAARLRGITVTNTPGANSDSVADLALALLLGSLRTVNAGSAAVRRGDWSAIRGREIASLHIGIGGFGRIGRLLAQRVCALGAKVSVYDPYLSPEETLPPGHSRAGDFAALSACDAVSLHAPGGRTLVDDAWLEGARGVALVNTARADLIDEHAVAAALRSGRLASYAGDTLADESQAALKSPLLDEGIADRVVITPHLGAQTVQAIDRMGQGAVDNVLAVLAGAGPLTPVVLQPA